MITTKMVTVMFQEFRRRVAAREAVEGKEVSCLLSLHSDHRKIIHLDDIAYYIILS